MALSGIGGITVATLSSGSLPVSADNNPISQVTAHLFSFQDGLEALTDQLTELRIQFPGNPDVAAFGQAFENLIASHAATVARIIASLR